MAVNLAPPENLHAVKGLRLGTAKAGMRKKDRRDLCLVELAPGSRVSAVFTRNAFCAAPVTVARQHLSAATPRALLINTGSANAGTGALGIENAQRCCAMVADLLGCDDTEVLPFSTGVIAEHLNMEAVQRALPSTHAQLSNEGWGLAAEAIMTTDTIPKAVSRQCQLHGETVTVTGMSKGAGMIRPDMATMLAFIATDAEVEQSALDHCLREAVNNSFNCITVDGDTSTNDACVLMATGAASTGLIKVEDAEFASLAACISSVCLELAQAIVRDGEGATRFVTLQVEQAVSVEEARSVADTIAHSPLVKTALFAGDPNWGRILAAIGRSPVVDLDLTAVSLWLDDVCLVADGEIAPDYQESAAAAVVAKDEYLIRVALGRGNAQTRIWTCDLSYDYVRINAEYRS